MKTYKDLVEASKDSTIIKDTATAMSVLKALGNGFGHPVKSANTVSTDKYGRTTIEVNVTGTFTVNSFLMDRLQSASGDKEIFVEITPKHVSVTYTPKK